MNKIYKVVWSKARGCYMVVSELAKNTTKGCSSKKFIAMLIATGVLSAGLPGVAGATDILYGSTDRDNIPTGVTNNSNTMGVKTTDDSMSSVVDAILTNADFTVTGGTWGEVYGGWSDSNNVSSNTVTISSTETTTPTINGYVFGGRSDSGNVSSNTVNISGGTINSTYFICGGYTEQGDATNNRVNISGGTITSEEGAPYGVSGGVAINSVASSNEVNISGGTISLVHGGRSYGGAAGGDQKDAGNTVNISGGEITGNVYGGCSDSGNVSSNTVNISGGTINSNNGNVYGGCSGSGNVSNNTLIITGGTIKGSVYGGKSVGGTASRNTINLGGYKDADADAITTTDTWKATINGDVYINAKMIFNEDDFSYSLTSATGGTLNVYSVGNTINNNANLHANGASVNFYIPATAKSDDTMLKVAGTADLTGATINTDTTNYNGGTITLLSTGTDTDWSAVSKWAIDGTNYSSKEKTITGKTIYAFTDVITKVKVQKVGYDTSDKKNLTFGATLYKVNGTSYVTGDVNLAKPLDLNSKTINMQQDASATGDDVKYSTLTVDKLSSTGSLAIDADLAKNSSDKITVTADGSTATLNLSSILVRSDSNTDSGAVTYVDGAGKDSITYTINAGGTAPGSTTGTNIVVGTSDYTYTFVLGTTKGQATFTRAANMNLADFITGNGSGATATAYTLTKDTTFTSADQLVTNRTDATASKDLTLGINQDITLSGLYDASDNTKKANGIAVANGYSLDVAGATSGGANNGVISGFTTALTNNEGGTLKVSNVTFANNDKDILNSGTATLTNVTANTIENKGTLTIAAGDNAATITGADGALTLGDGTDAVAITNSCAVAQKTVTVAANATVTNEASITASEGITINASGTLSTATDNINGGTNGITNNGALTLKGDNLALENNIIGNGTTTIDGTITSAKSIANAVTIKANKSLSNSGTISGAITNNGTLTNTGTLSGQVTNSGTMTTTANGITGGVTNNSAITLTEGTLAGDISGSGTTTIDGTVTSNKTIANTVTINAGKSLTNSGTVNGAVTINAEGTSLGSVTNSGTISGIVTNNGTLTNTGTLSGKVTNSGTMETTANGITGGVENNNALKLTGGVLANNIMGSGTTTIDGEVAFGSGKTVANAVTINASKSLTNSGTISGAVTNNGTLENKGSINNYVTNSGTLTNTAGYTISGNVINNSGATLNASLADIATASGKTVTNDGTFNLSGNVSKTVAASSGKTGTLNINSDAALSASVQNQNITVAAGKTLTANNSTDYLNATDNLTLESGSTLNMKSSATPATYNTLTVGTLTANDAKLSFDLDVKKDATGDVVQTDKLVATKATGTLTLDSVNVTADLGAEPAVGTSLSFTLVDSADDSGLTISGTTTATSSGYKYVFAQDATDKGKLTATKDYTGSLDDIIQNHKDSQSYNLGNIATYSLVGDYEAAENLGTLTRVDTSTPRTFNINGNNHTLSTAAADKGGVTVNSGDTLNLKDITINGFATAVTNNSGAIVNVEGVTFTGTTGAADIANNGTLNVNGTLNLDKGISGTGTTNFNVDFTNTKTITNNVTVAASKTLTNNGTIDGNVTNTGTLKNTEGQTISGSVTNNSGATLSASLADIATGSGKTVTNNGTFNMSGNLSKNIAGSGTTVLQNDITLAGADGNNADRTIDGTLDINGKTINMQEAADATGSAVGYNTLTVGTLVGTGNLYIDADLANSNNDKLNVSAAASGTKLDLSSILVRSDSAGDTGSITYVTGNGASAINYTINANSTSGGTAGTSIVAGTSDYTYNFILDPTNKGNATFTRALSMTMSDFITGTGQGATATAYTLTKNTTFADANALTTSRPDGSSKDLTLGINEGVTLSGVYSEGQKANGIIIANGYNLSFEGPATGAATMSGFTTALTNNTGGTLNVSNITFAENTTDIANSGTLTFTGTNALSDAVSNSGTIYVGSNTDSSKTSTTTINSISQSSGSTTIATGSSLNADAITLTGGSLTNNGNLNMNDGSGSDKLDIQTGGTFTNSGTANITNISNAGTLKLAGSSSMNSVAGTGITEITGGTTTVANGFTQNSLTVDSGASYVQNGGSFVVNGDVTNKGNVTLNDLGKGDNENPEKASFETAKNKVTGTLTNDGTFILNGTWLTVGHFNGNNVVVNGDSKFLVTESGEYNKIEVKEGGESELSGDNTVSENVDVKGGTLEIANNNKEAAMSVTTVDKDLNSSEGTVKVAEGAALVVNGDVNSSTGTISLAGTMAAVTEDKKVQINDLSGQINSKGELLVNTINVKNNTEENKLIDIGTAKNVAINVIQAGSNNVETANNTDAAIANVEKRGIQSFVENLNTGSSFNMQEGLVRGETSYVNDGSGVQKVAKANTANSQVSGALSSSAAFNKMEANDIRKRIGDVRLTNAADGIWTRFEKGQLEGSGVEHGFNKYQIGADHKVSDKWRVGGAFSYTKGTAEYARGENNVDTFSLAGYGVYTGKNGEYADIIGRIGLDNIDMDFYASSAMVHQHGKLITGSMALSDEIGKTYMMKNHFFIEPQAELMYTHTTGDNFTSNGVNYDLSSMDSLQGRLGFAFGYQAPDKSGVIYTRISALHEFGGRRSFDVSSECGSEPNYSDGVNTWWEWAVGGQINLSKATYFYADIERTWGATMDEKYRATAGFRFSF